MDVERVIKLGGGVVAMAQALAIDHSAVSKWKRRAHKGVPAKHVGRVSALINVPLHELRPDLFPVPVKP